MNQRLAWLAAPVVAGALLTAPLAHAAPKPSGGRVIGHIAYLTDNQVIRTATVHASGETSDVTKIGPISPVPAGSTIQVYNLVASSDGKWVAWQENLVKANGDFAKPRVVLRNLSSGKAFGLDVEQGPIGFASDNRLVTSNGSSIKIFKVTPSPHLVKVPDSKNAEAFAAYPHGVVDLNVPYAPHSKNLTEVLRLSTIGGTHKTLHRYVIKGDAASVDAGWVSSDGKRLVVERGDHTDFGGVGPSSLADQYTLGGPHDRQQLGDYGTAADQWRIGQVSFAGKANTVYAMWLRTTNQDQHAESVVAKFAGGTWTKVVAHGIAVAGNHAGYVVVQPGKYVAPPSSQAELGFVTKPISDALLLHAGATTPLDAEGTSFVWLGH